QLLFFCFIMLLEMETHSSQVWRCSCYFFSFGTFQLNDDKTKYLHCRFLLFTN
ncbi:hypothetical protein ACJX0J_016380, partial [Zea mays]